MTKYRIINAEPIEIYPDPDQTPGIMDTLQPGEIPDEVPEVPEPPEPIEPIEPELRGAFFRRKLEDKTAEKKYEERREQLKGLRQDDVLKEAYEEKQRREQLEAEQQEKELGEYGKITEPETKEERTRLKELEGDVNKIIISEGLQDEGIREEKELDELLEGEEEEEEDEVDRDKDSPDGPTPPKKRRRKRQG